MFRITKKHILRLVERTGYVVTKVADDDQRKQFIGELEAELTRRAERIAELERFQDALAKERERTLQIARKLSELEHEYRLGRERDARELEAARTEAWELKTLAAELRQQLDHVRHEQGERSAFLRPDPAGSADPSEDAVAQRRGEHEGPPPVLDENRAGFGRPAKTTAG